MSDGQTAVLILHYGEPDLTNNCIQSLRESLKDLRSVDIFVIDNSEAQDFVIFEKETKANIRVLKTGQNLGYAGGMNYGIRESLTSHPSFLLLLNNDVIVENKCLAELRDFMSSHPRAGIVSPLILYKNAPERIWATGSRLYFTLGRAVDPYHDRQYEGGFQEPMQADSVTGCAMMIRASLFGQIGMFDENYFSYYEDVDFCYRARLFGYEIYCHPFARVLHWVSGSLQPKAPLQRQPHYLMIKNRIYFMQKYSGRPQLYTFYGWIGIEIMGKVIALIPLLRFRKLLAFVLGVCDAIKPEPAEEVLQSLERISACIITKNAEKTIERCLISLEEAAAEIVIVDSGSTDNTLSICRRYTDRIYRTDFDRDFSSLRNLASQYARHPWILALDADEYLSDELRMNLCRLTSNPRVKGYYFRRTNYYGDKIISYGFLRFDLLLRLYQKEGSFFHGRVHEKVITAGKNKKTPYVLFHQQGVNNFTYYSFITKWRRYLDIEAGEKAEKSKRERRWLYLFIGPVSFVLVFFRDLLLLFGILDGLKGIKIAYFRALYTYELYLAIFRKLS